MDTNTPTEAPGMSPQLSVVEQPKDINYPCDKCDRVFSSYQALSVHKARKHGKNWIAGQAGSRLKKKRLKAGLTICPVCTRSFPTRVSMRMHLFDSHKKRIGDFPGLSIKGSQHKVSKEVIAVSASPPQPQKIQIRGHIDYCPRCSEFLKPYELAAGLIHKNQ